MHVIAQLWKFVFFLDSGNSSVKQVGITVFHVFLCVHLVLLLFTDFKEQLLICLLEKICIHANQLRRKIPPGVRFTHAKGGGYVTGVCLSD